LAVTGAIVLAAVAALSLTSYVRGAQASAVKAEDPVQAYVAKDLIPSGMTAGLAISSGKIVTASVPRRTVPAGAIHSLSDITGKVAAADILKGEQIMSARFVAQADARGLLPIPADRQAVAIEVGIPAGVASFIQPGDHVSVVADLAQAGAGGPGAQGAEAKYLLQNVQVLAVGQRVVSTSTKQGNQTATQAESKVLMTLALTPEEAEKAVFAIFNGQLYFTLVPTGQAPATTPGRTPATLFN
jgi:pilus assembly protein CpaB